MTHADAQELIAAYVMNVLEPDEQRALEAHLDGCEECRQELARLLEVGAAMAAGLPQTPPPAALREAVMAAVRPAPARRPAAVWFAVAALGVIAGTMVQLAGRLSLLLPTDLDRATRLAALLVAVVVFGVVVAVVARLFQLVTTAPSGGPWVVPAARPTPLWLAVGTVIIVLLGAQVLLVQRQNAGLSAELDQQSRLLAMLTSPTSTTIALTGSAPGSVRLVVNVKVHEGVLIANGLASPTAGSVYQLWLLGGPKPESGAVFSAGPQGTTITVLGADFSRYRAVAITVEPGPRGSPQPTTTPILTGRLPGGSA